MDRVFIRLGAVAGFVGVALGAFGAHAHRPAAGAAHHRRRLVLKNAFRGVAAIVGCVMTVTLAGQTPSPVSQSTLVVNALTTEYRVNPLGTDTPRPRLSWKLVSPLRNTVQAAYQIQVATDAAALASGRQLEWDSGKVTSGDSIFRPYGGPPLRSRTRYYWRVRVWDGNGIASPWSTPSTPAFWETGLMGRADWTAQWIRSTGISERRIRWPGTNVPSRLHRPRPGRIRARVHHEPRALRAPSEREAGQ